MPFPETQRVIYNKNPLDQVICQFRFPPILKIEKEIPADFQEIIKNEFPNFIEKTNFFNTDAKSELNIPQEIIDHIQKSNKNYEFSSEDGIWKINLTRTFIALTCNKYEKWENFKTKLELPLKALKISYSPPYFNRVGLRYIDVFQKSKLGLESTQWNELLQPHILGLLCSNEIANRIKAFDNIYELLLDDNKSQVKIMTKFVGYVKTNETCYMIDSDFSSQENLTYEESINRLDYLNKKAGRLLRWCITDKLHNAMEPKEL